MSILIQICVEYSWSIRDWPVLLGMEQVRMQEGSTMEMTFELDSEKKSIQS